MFRTNELNVLQTFVFELIVDNRSTIEMDL